MFQQLTIVGRVGRDSELRMTPNGKPVLGFSIAVSTKRKGGEETTTWYDASIWGEFGEKMSQYVTKGSMVLLTGIPTVRAWSRKSDGQPVASIGINVDQIRLLGGGQRRDAEQHDEWGHAPGDEHNGPAGASAFDPDEIPF